MRRFGTATLALALAAGCDRRACPSCPEPGAAPTPVLQAGHGAAITGALPTGDAVAEAMGRVEDRVRRCGPFPGVRRAMVGVVFAGTGAAIEAHAFPPLAGTAQGACVQDVVREATLPVTNGRALELTWAFDVTTVVTAAQTPAAPARPAAHGPVGCGRLDPETGLIRVCFE